jgi:HAD superfamily hydrolase (TIGR01509 family)
VRSDRAVLFDLDGVIVDSRTYHLEAWHALARERGWRHAPGYFTDTFGLRNDAIIGRLVPGIARDELVAAATRKEEMFRAAARGKLVALPGVRDLLDVLEREEVPRAVVTSTPRANLDFIIEQLRLGGRFQGLVAEEDAAKGKPDPEGFVAGAGRAGVPPDECVVIEDAPAGLAAAKSAGMRAIGVTTTRPAVDLGDADLVVDSLSEERVRTFILE